MHRAGSQLAGRYRLTHWLASGGMGDVWAARDELLDRDVAAKLVKPEYAGDPVFSQRLREEARAAAAVRNPHVVCIYDVGETTDHDVPVDYIIMELLAARSLSTIMADGPMPAAEVADLLAQVGDALATAHACGVVHRDIKPANLVRDESGHATVLDFGIARAADAAPLTDTGMMIGTARYISPEQVAGEPATAASDVYSLGVVAYECLAGHPPFEAGSDVATALAHREQVAAPLPAHVPAALASLVEQCMAKLPAQRPTAAALARRAAELDGRQPVGQSGDTLVMPVAGQSANDPVDVPATAPKAAASAALPAWLEWRKLAAVAGAAVVIVAIIAIVGTGGGGAPSSSAASRGPSAAPAADRSTPQQVRVRPHRYLGERYGVVQRQLRRLGLRPHEVGSSSPGARVTALSPVGTVAAGHPIAVTAIGVTQPAKKPAPKPAPVKKVKPPKGPHGHGHVPPGQAKKH